MRMREIKQIIDENESKLNTAIFKKQTNGYYTVENFLTLKEGLQQFSQITFFNHNINQILSSDLGLIVNNQFNTHPNEYHSFTSSLISFKDELQVYKKIINHFVTSLDPNTISLKLYPFQSFEDFRTFNDTIETKVLLPLDRLNIKISIGELEVGSQWMNIVVESLVGVSLIIHIVRAVFDIIKHDHQTIKVMDDLISTMKKGKNNIEEIQKHRDDTRKKFIEKQIELVISETTNDPRLSEKEKQNFLKGKEDLLKEFDTAIQMSMKELQQQIELGLEIHDAIDVPKKERYEVIDYKKLRQAFLPEPPVKIQHQEDNTGEEEPTEEAPE